MKEATRSNDHDPVMRGFGKLLNVANLISGTILIVMVAITCYEVAARYAFNSPTIWSFDLSIYLLLWLSFLSIAYLEKEDRHVNVDLVESHFPPRTKAIWDIVKAIIFLVFSVILTWLTFCFAVESFRINEYTPSMMRVIYWPIKVALPIGMSLVSMYLVMKIVSKIRFVRSKEFEKEKGIFANVWIILCIFLALVVGSILLFKINVVLGMCVLMIVMLVTGVCIFSALGLTAIIGYYMVFGGYGALRAFIPQITFEALNHYAIVCIPLFILTGQVLQKAGVSDELYNVVTKWVGHLPGGEAIATILACAIFAAISTSSVATAVTIGMIALPALAARNYNKRFSYGVLAAGGTLGLMIPPSGAMIVYSMVTEESLGKLFLAGAIPGLILASCFIAYSVYFCVKTGEYDRQERSTWAARFKATREGMWGLIAPFLILGGIYTGIFTALEAGAVAAGYSILMVLIRKKLYYKNMPQIIGESTLSSVMLTSIIIGAMMLGDFMTLSKMPEKAMELVQYLGLSRWEVIVAIIVMYFFMGMFIEVTASMLITLPILYPLIISLGFDGIWFAVIVTLNMEMVVLTPPVGLNLFVIQGITKASLKDVVMGVIPFFIIMMSMNLVFCLFPQLSLWLPNLMIK